MSGTSSGRGTRSALKTLTFSVRTSAASSVIGGSMATIEATCSRWLCTMSRMAPPEGLS